MPWVTPDLLDNPVGHNSGPRRRKPFKFGPLQGLWPEERLVLSKAFFSLWSHFQARIQLQSTVIMIKSKCSALQAAYLEFLLKGWWAGVCAGYGKKKKKKIKMTAPTVRSKLL